MRKHVLELVKEKVDRWDFTGDISILMFITEADEINVIVADTPEMERLGQEARIDVPKP